MREHQEEKGRGWEEETVGSEEEQGKMLREHQEEKGRGREKERIGSEEE